MRRRPPSSFSPEATLLEKHPELELDWHSMGHRDVLNNYEKTRSYKGTDPIHWKKPDSFTRADNACGEAAGTLVALQKLATLASDNAFEDNLGYDDAGQRQALLTRVKVASQQLMLAQLQLERLEAVSEYRWLQENVPGDFTSMPANFRKQYTNTPILVNDSRFQDLRAVVEDPARAVPLLEGSVAEQFEALGVAVDELELHMHQRGPLFGLHDRGHRMMAMRDHRTCLDILIPHVRASIEMIEKELPTMGRFAAHAMATHRNGEAQPAPPVSYLDVPFKQPGETPNPNGVDSVVRVDFRKKERVEEPPSGPTHADERRAWQNREAAREAETEGPDTPSRP